MRSLRDQLIDLLNLSLSIFPAIDFDRLELNVLKLEGLGEILRRIVLASRFVSVTVYAQEIVSRYVALLKKAARRRDQMTVAEERVDGIVDLPLDFVASFHELADCLVALLLKS